MERIDKVQNLIPEKPEFVHSNQEKGEAIESLKIVNRPVVKKDAAALVTGKSVYTNDTGGGLRAESGKKQSYHGRHDVDEIRKCKSEDNH